MATLAPSREAPPYELLRDCAIPTADVTTNGAIAKSLQEARAALVRCNADKAALREWSGDTK